MEAFARDLGYALRRLRQAPAFTAFAVASLALGIGVSVAIYSAVRTLLWMPLGIPRTGDLAVIHNPRVFPAMSWLDFQDFRAQQTSGNPVAAAVLVRTAFRADGASQTVFGGAVSGDYFTVMAQRPRVGRLLDRQDEQRAVAVVVLSEALWRTQLNGDPAVVGRTIALGGQSFEVIGVVAGAFRGLELVVPQSVWVPVTALPRDPRAFSLAPNVLTERRTRDFGVWSRLRPGESVARLTAEAGAIARRIDESFPPSAGGLRNFTREWRVDRFGDEQRRGAEAVQTLVVSIMVAVAVVLLVACTNLANLALARGTARAQETAVRTALGASRGRLVREQLLETGLVVVAGVGLAWALLLRMVDAFSLDLPIGRGTTIAFRPEIDGAVLAAACLSAVLALAVVGLWPALRSARADICRGIGAGASATPPRWRLHRNLIAWQVCGSVTLLLVAIMSVRIVTDPMQSTLTPRFRDLALAQIDFVLNGVDESRARQSVERIVSHLRGTGAFVDVSATNGSPNSFEGKRMVVTRPDLPLVAGGANAPQIAISAVAPAFLAMLNVPVVRGRGLTDTDDAAAPRVAIVTEQLARELFQTTDVVGRTLALGAAGPRQSLVSIVGVTRDIQISPTALRPDRLMFVPIAQAYDHRVPVLFVVRASNPSAAAGRLREEIRKLEPGLTLSASGTGGVLLEGPFFMLRVIAAMAAVLGSLALVLAMAGLFGILTHVVERRTREIGIRLAIGAERSRIIRLIVRDGVYPVVKGLALGLAIGLGSRIVLRGRLFTSVAAWDPLEFAALPAVFIAAALVACALPAIRASRVDPNVALREL